MKSRYDRAPGKEAAIANTRQNRMEGEHVATDAFVKKVQEKQAVHGGRPPKLEAASLEFNAYMCNNGRHAQELAQKMTEGLDKTAFPVKPVISSESD